MSVPRLTRLDFQLAYLVLLTRHGLKPLSRWEGRLSQEQHDIIRSGGLALDTASRRSRIGRKVVETVFARISGYTDLYRKRFDGTRLKETPDMVRLEGRLFGYPSCCVETFIRHPYAPNGLDPSDQEILFHWACPGCQTTPRLMREYRRVYTECRQLFGSRTQPRRHSSLGMTRAIAKVAASLALAAGTAGLAWATDDPHWLPVADDLDQDYLSFAEEIFRGTDWENPDTDQNQVLDGVQVSLLIRQLIESPPPGVEVEEHQVYGTETCSVCGAIVNMGHVSITHQQRGLSVDLPFIALHYLEHGSLGYEGDIHVGRADLDILKRILFPCDPPHLLPVEGEDPDTDGLLTEEEPLLGTDPSDPDTDDDSLIDGPQVAEGLLPIIGELPREEVLDRPYMLETRMWGSEECEVCGAVLNMGYAEIVNPLEGFSLTAPFVALHTLAHGGHVFDGTLSDGRLLPTVLRTVLSGDGTAHWIPVPFDADGDGLMDEEEAYFGMDPEDPDQDGNGVPDGRQLALAMASEIHELPEGPLPDQTYVIHCPTYGFYNCLTCAEQINMGHLQITDPVAGHSVDVPYYNLHFMDHGSFSTEREDIYPRIDPRLIGEVLGIHAGDVQHEPDAPAFALWNAPNPFASAGKTEIILSLPAKAGAIEVGIYDNAGRKVRDLFAGDAPGGVMRLQWDGRNNRGEAMGPGTYFSKVRIGSITVARKMTLVH